MLNGFRCEAHCHAKTPVFPTVKVFLESVGNVRVSSLPDDNINGRRNLKRISRLADLRCQRSGLSLSSPVHSMTSGVVRYPCHGTLDCPLAN